MALSQVNRLRQRVEQSRNLHCIAICRTQPERPARCSLLPCYSQYNFLLYTKPDCPLCDGLKVIKLAAYCFETCSIGSETGTILQGKLQGVIDRAEFMPSFLTGATLEVRDISTNEAWQDAMHLSVPVLAVVDGSGIETVIPRPQPRITADRLQRHLREALDAVNSQKQEQG